MNNRPTLTTSKAGIGRFTQTINGKVISVFAVLCLMIILIGGVGMYVVSQTTESLRTVYEDRTVCAGQLAEISSRLFDTNSNLGLVAGGQSKDNATLISDAEENLVQIDKIWKEYSSTYLTPEEKKLADEFAQQYSELLQNTFRPAFALAKAGKTTDLAVLLSTTNKYFMGSSDTNGKLIQLQLDVAKEEYANAQKNHTIGTWLSVCNIILGLGVAVWASRYLKRTLDGRLNYLDTRLTSIAGGNYVTDIQTGEDELQNILSTTHELQNKLAQAVEEKKKMEAEKIDGQKKLAMRFESEVGGLISGISTAATELQSTAESMGATAEETSRQSAAVAAASEQATANVQTVSAASEELASSIQEIQNQVGQSTKRISEAVQQANATNEKVRSLSDAAQKIGSVIDIIREIAGQTNLLALNATIEAARAGEAGKGFAVVASEVKSLAGQTARATEEISQQVAHIQAETRHSVEAIQLISGKIDEVNAISSTIAQAVGQQGEATQEIARNVTEAATGTQEVTSNITNVREAAQSTGAAAGQVLAAAGELAKNGELLKANVRTFLDGMMA